MSNITTIILVTTSAALTGLAFYLILGSFTSLITNVLMGI